MSPQAGFVLQDQVVPRLRSAIPNVVHCVGAEDAQELIQDSIAMAAKLMHNVEADDVYRPSAWSSFGTEGLEGADFRACQTYGSIYG